MSGSLLRCPQGVARVEGRSPRSRGDDPRRSPGAARRGHSPLAGDGDRDSTIPAPSGCRGPPREAIRRAVTKKVQGETAGALADLLGSILTVKIAYPGKKKHIQMVAAYLGRTTRIKYARQDLIRACTFLELAGNHDELLKKLANRGVKLHPDTLEFPMLLGTMEMKKGPFKADFKQARKNFETALRLAEGEAKADPKVAALVPKIRQFLTRPERPDRRPPRDAVPLLRRWQRSAS